MNRIDHKIISELQLDGRTTFKRLAEITGYSSMGIKKRFENLKKRGVIKVSALLNMEID